MRSRGLGPSEPAPFADGAALVADDTAWVLVEGDASGGIGPALAWAARRELVEVAVVCTGDGAGDAARRAGLFDPAPRVLRVDGTDLVDVEATPVAELAAPPDDPVRTAQLRDAGLHVVVEDGRLLGEVRGLEVARVEAGPDGPELHIGVGEYDRELTAMVHAELTRPDALARVAEIVREHRRAEGPQHPLRDLVPERWLRARLLAEPGLVGCAELDAVPSPFPRANLLERSVAVAGGVDDRGARVVVVTSVGIDLDLVPTAADIGATVDPDARLLVVVPARDVHPVTTAMNGRLASPAEVVTVPDDWRRD